MINERSENKGAEEGLDEGLRSYGIKVPTFFEEDLHVDEEIVKNNDIHLDIDEDVEEIVKGDGSYFGNQTLSFIGN